jgi:hypothetical protein
MGGTFKVNICGRRAHDALSLSSDDTEIISERKLDFENERIANHRLTWLWRTLFCIIYPHLRTPVIHLMLATFIKSISERGDGNFLSIM